jgi:nitroreductase
MKPGQLFHLAMCMLAVAPAMAAATEARTIPLPARPANVGMDLAKALEQRRTTREFGAGELSMEDLSAILWAANGVNRPDGKRTAPTARGEQYTDIYVVGNDGAYLYDAPGHALRLVRPGNLKGRLAHQEHVAAASHVLVLVADMDRITGPLSSGEADLDMAHATAGAIAQNVALMCAARGVGTGVVGWIRESGIREALGLRKHQCLFM